MIISYTGKGMLFLLIAPIAILLAFIISPIFGVNLGAIDAANEIAMAERRLQTLFVLSGGFILSSPIYWFLGKKVNAEKQIGVVPETNEPVYAKNLHTIWKLPVQYYSFITLGIGVILLVIGIA
ncbi:MAG: hypothetical protein FWH17_08190 [Oscillospiraceae bacterium]|nr:hypothetical protein [Oscillospiraceae bacterium]